MVGYHSSDSLTSNQKLAAGVTSGIVTRFLTQPIDVVKLRTQLSKQKTKPHRSIILRTTLKIFREEGITAFWHGHLLGQVHSVLAVSSQFYYYEVCTKYVVKTELTKTFNKTFLNFWCGILAGCVSATLVIPMEVIRVRQIMVKEQYNGLWNGAQQVYRSGGLLAFYEGWTASLLQMGPQVGMSFGIFRLVQPWLLRQLELHACPEDNCSNEKKRPEHILIASSVAGSVSGFVSKTATYPFDLVKRRLQIGSHIVQVQYKIPSTANRLIKCTRLMECLVKAFQKDGLKGLYRGWTVTVLKAQMTSVLAFTTYELTCHGIREFN